MNKKFFLPFTLGLSLGVSVISTSLAVSPEQNAQATPNVVNTQTVDTKPAKPVENQPVTKPVSQPVLNSVSQPANSTVTKPVTTVTTKSDDSDVQEQAKYLQPSILMEFKPSEAFTTALSSNQWMKNTYTDLINDIKYIHFNKVDFKTDKKAQRKFLEIYLRTLDPSKVYFTQEQVDSFYKSYVTQIPYNLDLTFKIYRTYVYDVSRFNYKVAKLLLAMNKEPNLNTNIKILKPKYASYVKANKYDQELNNTVLSMIISTKLNKPKFTWDQIRVRLIKGLIFKQHIINNYDPKDVFKTVANVLALSTDSHSNYYSPNDIAQFKEQISSSFVGIGVGISQDSTGVIKFTRVLKNGPSARNGNVKKDDELLAVSQDGFNWVSLTDMQLQKVTKLLKGKDNTAVWVKLLPKVGDVKIVKIIRGEVALDQVKAELTTYVDKGKTYGVLHFGSFYDGLTTDVAKLLDQHRNLSGLIIDLRNNGGGLVREVLGIANIFIDSDVPIFQTTSSNDSLYGDAKYSQISDNNSIVNNKYHFTKPIIVLVNSLSASASEIFAAAVQDYRRGLIVGSDSFGKGTVQSPNYVNGQNEDEGLIKLTIQKFFRVNGHSTQFKGVTPNIILPPVYYRPLLSEIGSLNPLPYTEIMANPDYETFADDYVTPAIIRALNVDVAKYYATNDDYKAYVDENKSIIAQQANKYTYLNYNKLLSFQQQADAYSVKAYNKYAKMNNKPTVKDADELDNLDEDKTLDPYLSLAKQLLITYCNKL